MPIFPDIRKWPALRGRLALLLGLGTLAATGDGAAATHVDQGNEPRSGVVERADLVVWSEGGQVYLSDGSGAATELRLGDTAEARHLRTLLERNGAAARAAGVRLDRMILAGGGGDGFHWAPPAQRPRADQANAAATAGTAQGSRSPIDRGTAAPRRAKRPDKD